MISSLTPSEKNCISGSLDRLSKASTASTGRSCDGEAAAGSAATRADAASDSGRVKR